MKITPRSEQEIGELGVLPEGKYDFEVIHAQEEQSKRGNEMLHIVCRVWPDNGAVPVRVHDYLLDLPYKGMATKLRQFCLATGLAQAYEQGNLLAENIIARSGRCEIAIQKDKTGEYEDRNVIANYCRTSDSPTETNSSIAKSNSQIPF
jgi:hypothetical protein